jgi:hypothetical protein
VSRVTPSSLNWDGTTPTNSFNMAGAAGANGNSNAAVLQAA